MKRFMISFGLFMGTACIIGGQETQYLDGPPVNMIEDDIEDHSQPNTRIDSIFDNVEPLLLDGEGEEKGEESQIEEFLVQEVPPELSSPASDSTSSDILTDRYLLDDDTPFISSPSGIEEFNLNDAVVEEGDLLGDPDIKILKVVVANSRIGVGNIQWVEAYVQNKFSQNKTVKVKLDFILPNKRLKTVDTKIVSLPATAVQNVIFKYRIPPKSGGVYLTKVRVNSLSGTLLSENEGRSEFLVLGDVIRDDRRFSLNLDDVDNFGRDAGSDNKFSLGFSQIIFANRQALVTDVISTSAIIKNSGVKNEDEVKVSIYLVRSPNLFAPLGAPVYYQDNILFAPGEEKQFKFNVIFPQDYPLEDYKLLGIIETGEPEEKITEFGNVVLSNNSLELVNIVIDTPKEQAVLNLSTSTRFSWRDFNFKQFFIEISSNSTFEDLDQILRVPKNDVTNLNFIDSLLVENILGESLQEFPSQNPLYWRVAGIDDLGLVTYSNSSSFFYRGGN